MRSTFISCHSSIEIVTEVQSCPLEADTLAFFFFDCSIHSPAALSCAGLMVPSFIMKSETTSKILVLCISRK